jgi:FAD/FMN-containing dehydrogenase
VIALNRLNRIVKLDPALRIAVVEPGVLNAQVSTAAAPHGLYYSPDPSSQTICTIGGNIPFNSGGAHCLKYGMTANHVLGLKAVLATGEEVQWGGLSRECVGPDWCGLFTGNEGLFGIALEITLQLLPKPECFHTVLAGYSTLEQAGDAVARQIDVYKRKRQESQPREPSAGCIFKNPITIPAGKLVEELGLKGLRVGGAVVSDIHGNFIVNDRHATAEDVLNLIKQIKERAKSARGIDLETEVEIIGEGS